MLVLSRKVGEEIYVPDFGVAIKVLGVKAGGVKLGIAAPAEVPVYRAELWERITETRISPGGNGDCAESPLAEGKSGDAGGSR